MVGTGRIYVRTDTFAGVDHHTPRCGHALYIHGWTSGVGACRGSGDCWAHLDMGAHARALRYLALQ